jgi:hypothetical protein
MAELSAVRLDGPRQVADSLSKPNVARMYDYYLGGKDNFGVDRECANQVIRLVPRMLEIARANRAFLCRVVRFLVERARVGQFLDIGVGLPTQENIHQVARRSNPTARVVYVDNDPMVLAHAQAILARDERTIAIEGDLRRPYDILTHDAVLQGLDLSQPVAVLLGAVLDFVPDRDDPYGAVRTLVETMAPGSCLVVSHAERHPEMARAADVYERSNAPTVLRSAEEITRFFDGTRMLAPGLVNISKWRPHHHADMRVRHFPFLGGVGIKL